MKILALVTSVVALISSYQAAQPVRHETYAQACYVAAIDCENDLVTVSTASGHYFQFYGVEDYDICDVVAVTFDDNGTPNNITDDAILDVQYSGFSVMQ